MARLLVIMGSGETAPTMVKPHRMILERVGDVPAVMMDTPYGFQENADDISTRAIGYFSASVGREITVATWRDRSASGATRERALGALSGAGWIFAGPGSPTYALRQWQGTPVPRILVDRLRDGGAVVFASAAALTLGSHTVPVYEIYKAGVDPVWVEGLDVVRRSTGLPAVIIPHYDNAEGGHHDTRFCYLGERRLSIMEAELPPESFILGIDEHTAAVLDIDAGTVSVVGNGTMTVRHRGDSVVHPSGSVVAFGDLTSDSAHASRPVTPIATGVLETAPPTTSMRDETDRLTALFAMAAETRDIEACVNAVLDLEQALVDWSADTLTSDEAGQARSSLRQMIVKLGDLARSAGGGPDAIDPYMDILVEIRRRVRQTRDFATSDWIRDELARLDVEIRDTSDGPTWHRA